jgi:signal transduction histidine kinase
MSIAQINRRHQLAPACGAWRRRDVLSPFGPFGGARRLVGRIGRAARGSSTQAAPVLIGHDLINCSAKKRFEVFLYSSLPLYFGFGVLVPLGLYKWVLRSPWWLAIAVVCGAQCVVVGAALRLARRGSFQQSITLVCISNWAVLLSATFVVPDLLPVWVLGALVPVAYLVAYSGWKRGLTFTVISAGWVLALGALARFQNVSHLSAHMPRAIQNAVFIPALVILALYLLVIVWNNAAALRTSEQLLAERAAQLAASSKRLITAADEERRRLERDLHDGAQQHLVALAVLLQLARSAEGDQHQPLLIEASGLLDNAIAEIRSLALGIYPPLLISGGLAEALPAVAARAPVPVKINLQGLRRYPVSIEAALYFCCSEALQNAAKHGGPDTTVTITAHVADRMLTLAISDTGRGFDPATVGTGLTNMADRLSAIGGCLAIHTAPGHGTRITASILTPARDGWSKPPEKGRPLLYEAGSDTPHNDGEADDRRSPRTPAELLLKT